MKKNVSWRDYFQAWGKYVKQSMLRRARGPNKRGYDAGGTVPTVPGWTRTPQSINVDIAGRVQALRARARDEAKNNDYAKRFFNLCRYNIAGPFGIRLQAQVKTTNGKTYTKINNAIEEHWKRWGEAVSCDVAGQESWVQMQQMASRTTAMDGEDFYRKIYSNPTTDNPYGFSIQQIDSEMIPVEFSRHKIGGSYVTMGIEFSEVGRPLKYYMRDGENYGDTYYNANSMRYKSVPADEIKHLYLKEFVGQARGVPWAATTLTRMLMLSAYQEASVINARTGAATVGLLTSEDGEPFEGDEVASDGSQVLDVEAGQIRDIGNRKLEMFDAKYPDGEFSEFCKGIIRGIAAGLDVNYHSLSGDLESVNYNSLRQGALDMRQIWMALQQWQIEKLNTWVYNNWLQRALAWGAIKVDGRPLTIASYEKYRQVKWMPYRWGWVDPLKDMQASVLAIENNLRTRTDVAAELGYDFDEIVERLKVEQEKLSAAGIKPAAAQNGGNTDGANEDESEQEPAETDDGGSSESGGADKKG